MVLNITTNKPTFYIRGLNSGTEYTVEIYAANARGASERTLFETFTLQVRIRFISVLTFLEKKALQNLAYSLLGFLCISKRIHFDFRCLKSNCKKEALLIQSPCP